MLCWMASFYVRQMVEIILFVFWFYTKEGCISTHYIVYVEMFLSKHVNSIINIL